VAVIRRSTRAKARRRSSYIRQTPIVTARRLMGAALMNARET